MRELIYVPIIHNSWGDYTKEDAKEADRVFPADFKRRVIQHLNEYGNCVDELLSNININKIYQDSFYLPCIEEYLTEEKEQQETKRLLDLCLDRRNYSRNFNTVCSLVENGSKLILTESKIAGQTFYDKLDINIFDTSDRDTFIAYRIDKTLQDGERGILLLGVSHNIEKYFNYSNLILNKSVNTKPLKEVAKLYLDFHSTTNNPEIKKYPRDLLEKAYEGL